MKNSESKLFRILQPFHSYSRFLITGTPLQNDLKELWSLLHFLLPTVFTEWELFEAYFDFSDLRDEKTTEGFLQEKKTHEMIAKIQQILQPLLLRRIKADVEHLLPKKREYILYAPMTQDQTELCDVISDDTRDTREYLEEKVVQRLIANTASDARKTKLSKVTKAEDSGSDSDDVPLAQLSIRKKARGRPPKSVPARNPFEQMMKGGKTDVKRKRKANDRTASPASKSSKSSRNSTPASTRTRKAKNSKSYSEAVSEEEDALSDDEFEEKLVQEGLEKDEVLEDELSPEESVEAKIKEAASKLMLNFSHFRVSVNLLQRKKCQPRSSATLLCNYD